MVQNHTLRADHKAHLQQSLIYAERLPQKISFLNNNPVMRIFWKGLRNTFGQYAWSWSLLIFGFAFAWFSAFYYPFIAIYQYNNQDVDSSNTQRTYAVAYARERAFKKKKEDEEKLAEETAAAEAAARGQEEPEEKPEEVVVKSSQEGDEDSGEVAAAAPVGFQAKPVSVSRAKTDKGDD